MQEDGQAGGQTDNGETNLRIFGTSSCERAQKEISLTNGNNRLFREDLPECYLGGGGGGGGCYIYHNIIGFFANK
jgi:hypothetical protein